MAHVSDYVFCADGGYVFPLKIAVASLLGSYGEKRSGLRLHVLDCGIKDADWRAVVSFWQQKFGCKFGIFRHVVDMSRLAHVSAYHGSRATYARLMLPEILEDIDWCVYSDCDVLFLDSPEHLFDVFDDEVVIAGPNNYKYFDADESFFRRHDLPFDRNKYICAGFILMNLSWMRKYGFSARSLDFFRKYTDVPTADQCALNYLAFGKIGVFPKEWGAVSPEAAQLDHVPFIHYASTLPMKPIRNWREYVDGTVLTQRLYRLFVFKLTHTHLPASFSQRILHFKRCCIGCLVIALRPIILRFQWIVSSRILRIFEENVPAKSVGVSLAIENVKSLVI